MAACQECAVGLCNTPGTSSWYLGKLGGKGPGGAQFLNTLLPSVDQYGRFKVVLTHSGSQIRVLLCFWHSRF